MKYQILPSLKAEDYTILEDDIKARGVLIPIEVDEDGNVLDGHHRKKIAESLGMDCPQVVRRGYTEDEKLAHVVSLNLARRHLTSTQRAELMGSLRGRGWSLRRIAGEVGVSKNTVHRDLVAIGGKVKSVTGADGKTYPAAKTPKPQIDPRAYKIAEYEKAAKEHAKKAAATRADEAKPPKQRKVRTDKQAMNSLSSLLISAIGLADSLEYGLEKNGSLSDPTVVKDLEKALERIDQIVSNTRIANTYVKKLQKAYKDVAPPSLNPASPHALDAPPNTP